LEEVAEPMANEKWKMENGMPQQIEIKVNMILGLEVQEWQEWQE